MIPQIISDAQARRAAFAFFAELGARPVGQFLEDGRCPEQREALIPAFKAALMAAWTAA